MPFLLHECLKETAFVLKIQSLPVLKHSYSFTWERDEEEKDY